MLHTGWRWPALLVLVAAVSAGSAWIVTSPSPARRLEMQVVASPPPAPAARSAQIAGAVANPGVYPLSAGTRLVDLLAMAGGATASAETSRLNLARRVADGERIDIPEREAIHAPEQLKLNQASHGQLLALPGMTEQAAQAIADSVRSAGPISSAADLATRQIVQPALIERIAPLVDWTP